MNNDVAFYIKDKPVFEEEFYDSDTNTPKMFYHMNPNNKSNFISHIPYVWKEFPFNPNLDQYDEYHRNKDAVYDTLYNLDKDISKNTLAELFQYKNMGYSSSYIRTFAIDESNDRRIFTTGVCELPTKREIEYHSNPIGKFNHRWGMFEEYKTYTTRQVLKNMDDQVGTMINCHLAKKRFDILMVTREKPFTFHHQINNEPYYSRDDGWDYHSEPLELYKKGVSYYVMYWYNQEKYTSETALELIKYYASP